MIVQTIKVNNCNPQTIVIGRRGTYDTLQIAFDLSYLVESYGNGVAVLAVKRSQDESAYPAVATQEDNTLTWTVSETDTYYVGAGEAQLMWYVDGGLAKTIIYPMVVMRDILMTAEEPPEGYENWIEHLTGLGAETQQNAQNAAQSATEAKISEDNADESAQRAEDAAGLLVDVSATATTLDPGQPATAEYNDGVFEFGIPKGDKLTYADLTEADKEDLVQGPIKDAQDDAIEAVGTAKTNAVDAVNQAGTTQKNAVNQAGTTAVNAVGREGTTQVERVTTEGNTQVGRVQDKGDEVIASIPSDYSDLTAEVDDLSRHLSDLTVDYPISTNLLDYTKVSSNTYINPNGVIETLSGRFTTDYIPVVSGKKVVFSYIVNPASDPISYTISSCCFFNDALNVVPGGAYNVSNVTVPSNAKYIRLTAGSIMLSSEYGMVSLTDDGSTPSFEFFVGTEDNKGISKDLILQKRPLGYMQVKGSLSSGGSLNLPYHNVKNDNILQFVAKITTFDKLIIGKESTTFITIDSTNLTVNCDTVSPVAHAHGLTIANDIQVYITNKTDISAKIVLTSSGLSYTLEADRFIMDEGDRDGQYGAYARSDGSELTDCIFSWTSRNINKPIWFFGDSYFSWYSTNWTYYLAQDGYTESCLLNGYAGEASVNSVRALRSLLKVAVPQYVVWCVGMNDGDGTTAPNKYWSTEFKYLEEAAAFYGFELILATIPTTPVVNNAFKDAVIRESGYRYIDFDSAVDIDGNGTWITGALAQDQVHPTAIGAKILYNQLLADFPEVTTR